MKFRIRLIKSKLIAIIALSIMSFTTSAQTDAVVMTIDGNEITKSEFLQIYLKNNDDPKYDKASLDEYMILFKKFKLKVAEAEVMGYDTIPTLVRELDGYRKQLALPYLVDNEKNKELVKEAYERTKTEVRASHILINVSPKASPADTLIAYNKIMALKKRIESGEDFATVAQSKGGSDDPSAASNGGDLGYFTAFQMVYPFEEKAYTTPVGKVSSPFKTRFGYHILKVEATRPARGTIEAAHIMIALPKNPDAATIEAASNKINDIYKQLENGEDFASLSRKFSEDPTSSSRGGVLPKFGTGTSTRMVPEFEDAAFELKNDGDFSQPIKTAYGFHIIKRLAWSGIPAFEELEKELTAKVSKDMRAKQSQDSFVAKLKKEYGYKNKSTKGLKLFYSTVDSTYLKGKFTADMIESDALLFTLNGEKFTQQGFAKYLEKNFRSANRSHSIHQIIDEGYTAWEKQSILDYEESKLEGKYPAFAALITEYHDGILLYEVMSDEVWNKAMRDTVGLKTFFENNNSNYVWGKRIDANIYECYSIDFANQTYNLLKLDTLSNEAVISQINKETELNVTNRNGKFDIAKTNYLRTANLQKGLNEVFEFDGKFYVIQVNEILEPTQKEFADAKGAITSDYQTYLEKNWLIDLEKKHTIVVNEEVLYAIGQ